MKKYLFVPIFALFLFAGVLWALSDNDSSRDENGFHDNGEEPVNGGSGGGEEADPSKEPEDKLIRDGDAESISPVDDIIKSMSLEEKIGQMLVVGFEGIRLNDDLKLMIEEYHLGGVIFFERNVGTQEELKSLISSLQEKSRSEIPLLVCVDQEGGRIIRVPWNSSHIPANLHIGEKNDPDYSFGVGVYLAESIKQYGFNVNLAPVADIFSNPENRVIGDRALGSDPGTVSIHAAAIFRGMQSKGIASTAKHFPGHGDTKVDSHYNMPVVYHDLDYLREFELIPFQKLVDDGIELVMTAHISYPNIDEEGVPATLSEMLINDLLREEMGFNGVVISDDMEMGAIIQNYTVEEAAVKAVKAGVDIVLVAHSREQQIKTIKALKNAVNTGRISAERIDESVKRILMLKESF